MRELQQILKLWREVESAGESAVLATVVKTRGSSYRLPGARLLLTAGGKRAGSISGGCLEDELLKKAWWLTENGAVVRRYDTTPDGEISSGGYGLGCNGIIHVLLERVSPGNASVLDVIEEVRVQRRPALVAHAIEPAGLAGQRLVIDTRGEARDNFTDHELARVVRLEAGTGSQINSPSREVEVFLERLSPPTRLLVFGAGDDAIPLTDFAKYLGWQVFVFDGRAHYARREKFRQADEVVVRAPGQADSKLPIDDWTVAVLMSHSYSQDLAALRELWPQPLRYLGMLGPRKRSLQLLQDAGLENGKPNSALHYPVGLDIGADGPEQVALSVIAEIQATLNGRRGGLLRDRAGSIHASDEGPGDREQFWAPSIVCA